MIPEPMIPPMIPVAGGMGNLLPTMHECGAEIPSWGSYILLHFHKTSRENLHTGITDAIRAYRKIEISYQISLRGAPKGRARPPLGPEKHYIFRVSSVKLRDFHL